MAVVSRSYALYSVGQGLKYDVGTDTSSQVYGGYSAEQNFSAGKIIDAVNATKGKVIYYYNKNTGKKEIIQAFFHSNAGGYLKAVPSPEDAYAEEYGNQTGDS